MCRQAGRSKYSFKRFVTRLIARPTYSHAYLRSSFLSILFLLSPGRPAHAQEQPKIAVEVKVVNVLATVRDKHGKIVSNLAKDDFVLEEDGHPQTIAYF